MPQDSHVHLLFAKMFKTFFFLTGNRSLSARTVISILVRPRPKYAWNVWDIFAEFKLRYLENIKAQIQYLPFCHKAWYRFWYNRLHRALKLAAVGVVKRKGSCRVLNLVLCRLLRHPICLRGNRKLNPWPQRLKSGSVFRNCLLWIKQN